MPRNSVPPTKATFYMSAHEAGRLWADSSLITPDAYDRGSERLRISEDGRWVLHEVNLQLESPSSPIHDFTAEQISEAAESEFDRLQDTADEMGLDLEIVSRAITPSLLGKRIFTVTPWIPDLKPCPPTLFKNTLEATSRTYARSTPRHTKLVLRDYDHGSDQCSVRANQREKAILHDVDAYMMVV